MCVTCVHTKKQCTHSTLDEPPHTPHHTLTYPSDKSVSIEETPKLVDAVSSTSDSTTSGTPCYSIRCTPCYSTLALRTILRWHSVLFNPLILRAILSLGTPCYSVLPYYLFLLFFGTPFSHQYLRTPSSTSSFQQVIII